MPRWNTQRVSFKLVSGHVLLDLDGITTLLDTGSPVSFGTVPEVTILGTKHRLRRSIGGDAHFSDILVGLKRFAGVPSAFDFQVLLGRDLLAGKRLKLDWQSRVMTITEPSTPGTVRAGAPLRRGDLMVGGKRVRAILDTGAWRSYLPPDVAVGLERVGRGQDYNPVLGGITTDLVWARVRFRGWSGAVTMGIITHEHIAAFGERDAQAIVGNDILAKAGPLRMDVE